MEEMLKAGELPCLVATSSLELGIDMGAVDLVIQVESPKSVARGLQRIGRAGHSVGDVSRGRIFPKFRVRPARVRGRRAADARGADRDDRRPAQRPGRAGPADRRDGGRRRAGRRRRWRGERDGQRRRPVRARHPHPLLRRAQPRPQLENVLDMLDGRYPSSEFAELRPRIVWDRVAGTLRARPGARQLAVTNAGTIPDRGLFAVTLPDGRRVGELDEEMVYEARPGQTFLLGASTWRIEEIGRDRVIVTPAPGLPGAVPFWKGDTLGRPKELGEAIGAFARWAVDQTPQTARARLRPRRAGRQEPRASSSPSSSRRPAWCPATARSWSSGSAMRSATGGCASSPRSAGASTPPGRSRCPPASATSSGWRADAIYSDDGIIVHLPDAEEPPGAELVLLQPDEIEDLVVAELGSQRAVRRPLPGERRPGAADPARATGQAHAALAAAPEVPIAARGGQEVRRVPHHPRDLPRMPARRARRARRWSSCSPRSTAAS